MNITLNHNMGLDKEDIPYIATVEIIELTVDTNSVFEIPVHITYVGNQKVYDIEICGFRGEVEHSKEIPNLVERVLTSLVNMARLPSYVFIAREGGGVYPVYTVDNEVFATTPGGPLFQHVELAKVREYLGDYLHDIGILGENEVSDKLHVRGIDPKTLGLRRPALYLKKRVLNEIDFWAPVFESGNGKCIYTYAANERREVRIADGQEVLRLRQLVRKALLADGRLKNDYDLRPDRLYPEYWERLRATLTSEGNLVVNGVILELFSNDDAWFAVEARPEVGRYGLFIGKSKEYVEERACRDFERRGIK